MRRFDVAWDSLIESENSTDGGARFARKIAMTSGGIELSENKLRELAALLHGDDPMGRRSALRVPVEGFVTIDPLSAGGGAGARRVGVYDLSRTGIALVDRDPMEAGTEFNVLFIREDATTAQVLFTARHSRRYEDAYIIRAGFGVPWLAGLVASGTGGNSPP